MWCRKEFKNPTERASSSTEEALSALMRGVLGWGVSGVLQPSVLPGDLRHEVLGEGAGSEAMDWGLLCDDLSRENTPHWDP